MRSDSIQYGDVKQCNESDTRRASRPQRHSVKRQLADFRQHARRMVLLPDGGSTGHEHDVRSRCDQSGANHFITIGQQLGGLWKAAVAVPKWANDCPGRRFGLSIPPTMTMECVCAIRDAR